MAWIGHSKQLFYVDLINYLDSTLYADLANLY